MRRHSANHRHHLWEPSHKDRNVRMFHVYLHLEEHSHAIHYHIISAYECLVLTAHVNCVIVTTAVAWRLYRTVWMLSAIVLLVMAVASAVDAPFRRWFCSDSLCIASAHAFRNVRTMVRISYDCLITCSRGCICNRYDKYKFCLCIGHACLLGCVDGSHDSDGSRCRIK